MAVFRGWGFSVPWWINARDAWVINASATNALSPVITTLAGVWLNEGQNTSETYVASAIPAATFTQTGALPKGVTLSPSGLLSGVPAAGTGGVYPVTLTASNGVGVVAVPTSRSAAPIGASYLNAGKCESWQGGWLAA